MVTDILYHKSSDNTKFLVRKLTAQLTSSLTELDYALNNIKKSGLSYVIYVSTDLNLSNLLVSTTLES